MLESLGYQLPIYVCALAGILALLFAYVRSRAVNAADPGTKEMQVIAGHIREGAMAFLNREYRALAVFVVVVAGLLAFANLNNDKSHVLVALSFVVGAFCSGLAGYIGMRVATAANVRTSAAARSGLAKALAVAFSGGSVMGMTVVGLGLFGLSILFLFYTETSMITSNAFTVGAVPMKQILQVLAGFSLGASSIALFARVGGGIFTKAADVGADLVGKLEAGIPEDDPRNPATIADNVGDNVGDVAGMGADLFESYVGSIVGAMILGAAIAAGADAFLVEAGGGKGKIIHYHLIFLPLILAAVGIAGSMVGTFFVRTGDKGDPGKALHLGTLVAAVVTITGSYFIINKFLGTDALFLFKDGNMLPSLVDGKQAIENLIGAHVVAADGVFYALVAGLVVGTLIGLVTEYFTSDQYKPVKYIAKQSTTGAATNIIAGTAIGMISTAIPILLLVAGIVVSFNFAGVYGVAIAALGMLSTTGIQLAVDAFGPIADNAGGIAQMANMDPEVRERTDKLDAVGNTTAAIGKGFAIGSAALTALALFSAFMQTANIPSLNVMDPAIMAGIFIGAMLPYLFSAFAMLAVGKAAGQMIEEVRRQFREIPGLLEGTATADYKQCIEISTTAALKEMVIPGLLAVVVPVLVGIISLTALAGLLVGVTVSGVLLALFQSNAGGAWDNAKKYVESGNYGGKGSDAHAAAVTGDTVGDPYKDTAGPSLNILIKLISVVALVIAPALMDFHKSDAGARVRQSESSPKSLHEK
jgi:K(+)-stimulated pyrophosphate-energized sodium pump